MIRLPSALLIAAENWLTRKLMGYSIGLAKVAMIQCPAQAIHSAAFAILCACGAQERGFILLSALFGLPGLPLYQISAERLTLARR